MSTGNEEKIRNGTMDPALPGEEYEVRQVANSDDYTPDPSKSLKLEPPQQRLVDDVLELYSCRPTVERVKRYTPDCVYDDQFVYANDRYKMAGQWFGLPMGFDDSKNERYQVVVNQPGLIQFKNEQTWEFKGTGEKGRTTINALVSLSLDPSTIKSDFIQIKYHKDQADDKDYSHKGPGFLFKKKQADTVMKHMSGDEVQQFKADEGAGKNAVKKYKDGSDAPVKELAN